MSRRALGGLPAGFYPVVHVFGVDNYRITQQNPLHESWNKMWWNDSATDPNWPCFVEGVIMPRSQAPSGWFAVGGLLDKFPRRVYYGGPTSRVLAPDYAKTFQRWAAGLGYAYETAIVPVQPNSAGMRHPVTDFRWYIADETRPPKRYRLIRAYGTNNYRWIDMGFDTDKYANFHSQNPTII